MIPEIGQLALILALIMAGVQSILPLYGMVTRQAGLLNLATPAAVGQFLMLGLSFAALVWSFYINDFSVVYVAENSNTKLPWFYRLAATWGAHEGSLMLWAMLLAAWTLIVVLASRTLPRDITACVLAIMGLISIGFLLFSLATSNPFERQFPAPGQGRDLNPLLQDPGQVMHPPMLYMGYVGFCVAFAFAITALITGRVDSAWTRWTRPWTIAAWVFLTIGITLGSLWSYNELGWGGWWFWDPVENASFLPWLVGTALIHSLAVTERRGIFQSWTVLLAITAFSLSLLGTFLVRSGVLISVHAFATDPDRGIYILAFLGLVVGGSLLLYAFRANSLRIGDTPVAILSREGLLLLNNIFLLVAAAGILIGTIYPILADRLDMGRLSVGPPYFNKIFVPLMIPLLVIIGAGAAMAWKRTKARTLWVRLRWPLIVALAIGIIMPWLTVGLQPIGAIAGCVLGCWAIATALEDVLRRCKGRRIKIPRQILGMALAHAGVGIAVIGISLVSGFGMDRDARLSPGESIDFMGYTFTFHGIRDHQGPNYTARIGDFTINRDGRRIAHIHPAKRSYEASDMTTTESSIAYGFFRDLYVSLGNAMPDDSWSVRLYNRPFVRWIWAGGLLAAFGGILALADKRYWRHRQRRTRSRPTQHEGSS